MRMPALALVAFLLTACAHEARKPDPLAPVVMAEPMAVNCPEAKPRAVPVDLVAVMPLAAPRVHLTLNDDGTYRLTREGAEALTSALHSARYQLARWRAWASPKPDPPK